MPYQGTLILILAFSLGINKFSRKKGMLRGVTEGYQDQDLLLDVALDALD